MKLVIGQANGVDGDGVFVPVDPPETIEISDFFDLVDFRASSETALPLSMAAVNWSIAPKTADINVQDFQFRLVVIGHVQLNAIQPQGSAPFMITGSTRAVISGRKGNGAWSDFDKEVLIALDQSNCQVVTYPGNVLDGVVRTLMDRFLTTVDEVSLRTKTIPVDPQDPNGPVQVVRLKGESDYNSDRIRYKFPLEIKIPWFFDADLDVTMDVSFSLENTIENSILDFFVAFKIDASFDVGEHILSAVLPFPLGATFGIQKTLDTVLPMVFDCQVPAIEARLASFIVDDNVKSILKEMTEGRIFDIRISPVSATSNTNSLLLVLCPRTREAET